MTDAEKIAERASIISLSISSGVFILMVRTAQGEWEPVAWADLQIVSECQAVFKKAVMYAMKPYAKALESLRIIRDCSTDPLAAAEAKDFLDRVRAAGGDLSDETP